MYVFSLQVVTTLTRNKNESSEMNFGFESVLAIRICTTVITSHTHGDQYNDLEGRHVDHVWHVHEWIQI